MDNKKGYFSAITGIIIGFIIITLMAYFISGWRAPKSNIFGIDTVKNSGELGEKYSNGTFGLKQYADHDFGFSFWYPDNWNIREAPWTDANKFPGSKVVKYLKVGAEGNVYVFEVYSPKGIITDNPEAAPFPPVNYFWDTKTKTWMTSQPEDTSFEQSKATTTASVKGKTMSGLQIFAGNSRFDTSIIPINYNNFVVVSDGGGANADYLAKTVTLIGDSLNSPAQNEIMKEEADAYRASSQ